MQSKSVISLSNSSSNEIASCARKYQIRKRFKHSVSIYDKSLPAQSGTCVHNYLQAKMSGASERDALLAFYWDWDFSVEENDSPKNKRERSMEASLLSAMVAWKKLKFNPDNLARIETKDGDTIPAVEVGFEITLTSKHYKEAYKYIGFIDTITFQKENSLFNVYDIKTNRDLTSHPKEYKYKFDTQTIPYGLVIAAITGKPLEKFNANYIDVMIDPIEPRCLVIPFVRTQEDVLHWLTSLDRQIRMIDEYRDDDVWPRSTNGCVSWGKPCRYFKNCSVSDPYKLQLALTAFGPPKEPTEREIHIQTTLDVDQWLRR